MSLIKCPECDKEISDKAAFCPNCGYVINSTNAQNRKKKINKISTIILLCGIIIFIIAMIWGLSTVNHNLGIKAGYLFGDKIVYEDEFNSMTFVTTIQDFMTYTGIIVIVIGIILKIYCAIKYKQNNK